MDSETVNDIRRITLRDIDCTLFFEWTQQVTAQD